MLKQLVSTASTMASREQHRALIVLQTPPDGALSVFAATHKLAFIGAGNSADRADRVTEVLGREFDILVHETHEDIDAGLLAALAGTLIAGGVLILGLPFSLDPQSKTQSLSRFNQRFARLLSDMLPLFPDKVLWLKGSFDFDNIPQTSIFQQISEPPDTAPVSERSLSPNRAHHIATAEIEQKKLLTVAIEYLTNHPRGCITITGRRGRGKSALLGHITSWLNEQDITFAVTAARRSALVSLHRHSSADCDFIAPADAQRSGREVLLVDEASSLPLSLLESFLETHQHVIFCSTVEGYENAGRAFALRFDQLLKQRFAHALTLQPKAPWRWDAGDPLEYLIDTLLMSGNENVDSNSPPVTKRTLVTKQVHSDEDTESLLSDWHIRLLDRAALSLDEALLRQVFGLLRDTHYQTSAADLSHLLDAPDLQLWVLEEGGQVKAALMLVLEGGIDPSLHEAIVSKQRRLPHQLLPQLLAQSANDARALAAVYGRVIRIAVATQDRRRGLGSLLLHSVECAITPPNAHTSGIGASFASDIGSIAFWQSNGYTRFHTGFKSNARTAKRAIAVIKIRDPALESVVQHAVTIHDDNLRRIEHGPHLPGPKPGDTDLLKRFAQGQRSVHDTFAALNRLAQQHKIPLHQNPGTSRRRYEADLREAVKSVLQ